MLSRLLFDLSSALKSVRRGRSASIIAIVALALGVGASVTAGAVAYAGLLRPLPFTQGEQLVTFRRSFVPTGLTSSIRLVEFNEWRAGIANTSTLVAMSSARVTLRGAGAPEQISAGYVAGAFFHVLGAGAEAGRLFAEDDPADVAVVSRRLGERLAGSPAAAIGRVLTLGSRTLQVVGIAPVSLDVLGRDIDVWAQAQSADGVQVLGDTDRREYQMIARLRPGRSLADARADAERVLREHEPEQQRTNWRIEASTLRQNLLGDSRTVMLVFAGASLLVLIVACANVAMVLVNRAASRGREFALRLALGATRARLLSMTLLETAVLGVTGAAVGWWLAHMATGVLQNQTGLDMPALATISTGLPVAGGAVLAAFAVMLGCGAAPVIAMRSAAMATSLRTVTSSSTPGSRRLRDILVVAQLATAIVLVAGAGLLGRSLLLLSHTDVGLDARERVLTLSVPIGESSRTDKASRLALVDAMVERARQLPGVLAAGFGSNLPPSSRGIVFTVRYTSSDRNESRTFDVVPATPGYLEAMGARLVRGRLFSPDDVRSERSVAVLSETALRHLGQPLEVVDRELNMALPVDGGPRVKPLVIGVVRDVRYAGLETPADGNVYLLWRQIPLGGGFLTLRTAGDPAALGSALREIVRSADASMPAGRLQTLEGEVDRVLAPRAARFGLVGVFAGAAIILALVGLSSALIRSVMERQRELAIRTAMGATPLVLVRSVVLHGLGLAALGSVIGIAAAIAAGRAASSMILGIRPHDPLTYTLTVATVTLVALGACYVPARRAAAADPIALLHAE